MNARIGPYLGSLCRRGHDHEATRKSLRDQYGACIECERLSLNERRRRHAERMALRRRELQEAREQAGADITAEPQAEAPHPREKSRDPHWVPSEGPLTLEEIAIRMGVSRERVRQIEHDALRKLRRRFGRVLLEHLFSTVDPQPRGVRR